MRTTPGILAHPCQRQMLALPERGGCCPTRMVRPATLPAVVRGTIEDPGTGSLSRAAGGALAARLLAADRQPAPYLD